MLSIWTSFLYKYRKHISNHNNLFNEILECIAIYVLNGSQ